ncbi:MAG TPA: TIGR03668 family PPOX class F420-dependent oxidoreductase [Pseudonocardia sp.]|nr:TIGR03668 family PPOX class F420-dependent oxidoreductase [Pseudonocardia sp.]
MTRLAEAEVRRRLAEARVAYLGTVTDEGAPHLVPVTFDLTGASLVIAVDHKPKRTTALARLRNIAGNDKVSVLAEHYDDADWAALWWARADGRARVLTDEADRVDPVRRLSAKYAQYREQPPAGPVIWIDVERWTGWAYSS